MLGPAGDADDARNSLPGASHVRFVERTLQFRRLYPMFYTIVCHHASQYTSNEEEIPGTIATLGDT